MPYGIVSYGVYIPKYRIRVNEIARVWGDKDNIAQSLRVFEKSVPDLDEDAITIAVEAARNALARVEVDPARIGTLGIAGAGWASLMAGVTQIVAYSFILFRSGFRRRCRTLDWKPERRALAALIRYGLPSGIQMFIDAGGFTAFILLVGRLGRNEEASARAYRFRTRWPASPRTARTSC